jgi:hypothetical protein
LRALALHRSTVLLSGQLDLPHLPLEITHVVIVAINLRRLLDDLLDHLERVTLNDLLHRVDAHQQQAEWKDLCCKIASGTSFALD